MNGETSVSVSVYVAQQSDIYRDERAAHLHSEKEQGHKVKTKLNRIAFFPNNTNGPTHKVFLNIPRIQRIVKK